MSKHVYMDLRTRQLAASDAIIRQAMEQLSAQRSQISCGQAEVHTTDLNASRTGKALNDVRMQDTIEVGDTQGLQDRLGTDVADYSAQSLDDWKPAVDAPTIHVDQGKAEGHSDMRLVEDLECAALDGARMMIFEVDDGHGGTSYQIGLDTILFDEDGNWKSDSHKGAYENFLKQTFVAQRVALEEEKSKEPVSEQTAAAMRAAGLHTKSRKRVPGGVTHSVVTNHEGDKDKDNNRTRGVGKEDKRE